MNRLTALLAVIMLLPTGCVATGAAMGTPPGEPSPPVVSEGRFTLGLGQSTQLQDGSRLSYTSLVNDSRCAPDVQCIWAGDAEIELRWKPANGSAQDLRLHTNSRGGPTSTPIGTRTLSLVALERGIGPEATLSIADAP